MNLYAGEFFLMVKYTVNLHLKYSQIIHNYFHDNLQMRGVLSIRCWRWGLVFVYIFTFDIGFDNWGLFFTL